MQDGSTGATMTYEGPGRLRGAIVISCIMVLAGDNAAVAGDDAAELPPLSIDSVYKRRVSTVQNLRWFDQETLLGEFRETSPPRTLVRKIGLDGALGETIGEGKFSSPSPDGRLLVLRTNDEWTVHDLVSGEVTTLSVTDDRSSEFTGYFTPVWSPDGSWVAIVDYYSPDDNSATEQGRYDSGGPIVEVINSAATTERWASRIVIAKRENLQSVEKAYVDGFVGGVRWSADGSLLVSQTAFSSEVTRVLRIEPGRAGASSTYSSRGRYHRLIPSVSPDGNLLALVLDVDNRTWDDFQSLLLVDSETGRELHRLTHDLPILSGEYFWSPKGDEIFVRVRNGGLDQVYAIPLHGEPRKLTDGLRRHFDMDISPDGRWLSYQTMDGYGLRDIRILDLQVGDEKVVKVLDNPAEEFNLGKWQHVRWSSSDGVRPFGYLFTPPDFRIDQYYPMIVDVHGGGPGSQLFLSSSLSGGVPSGPLVWHAWAAEGYVVFVPDYRSTGEYGPRVIGERYKAGQLAAVKDIEDVDSGVQFVIDQGFIDPAKVAIHGHSAGGQRVYILLTKTDRYAAAVLHESIAPDPVSNFLELASGKYTGSYPSGVFRRYYGGSLAEVPCRYKANYMFDSYRNTTPTLIMLGNEALGGVKHMPNEVLYSILQQQNVPSRLLKFVAEGHNYSTSEAARFAFDEMYQWFSAYLTGAEEGDKFRDGRVTPTKSSSSNRCDP